MAVGPKHSFGVQLRKAAEIASGTDLRACFVLNLYFYYSFNTF